MSLSDDFKTFCGNLEPTEDELNDIDYKVKRITKKLNQHYYDIDSNEDYLYIVGSVGRNTALGGISDYDIIFDLPNSVFTQFDNHSGNGQSDLLQDVKKVVKETYSSTKVKGDGQVVVIEFTDYKIELVPGFKQNDDRFKYPDSNNGGSWKYTDPLPEKEASFSQIELTNGNYRHFSHILRSWKNKIGFKFKGLLIDTMVNNYFEENSQNKLISFDDYLTVLIEIFYYLKNQDEERSYWFALGSNQQISNDDNGVFIKKAKKAYNNISEITEEDDSINQVLKDLLGDAFPVHEQVQKDFAFREAFSSNQNNTEEFIEEKFKVDIQYNVYLNCNVEQDGFRINNLRKIIREKKFLRKNKKLHFYLDISSIPEYLRKEIKIYWKVRNVGAEAIRRKMIRGQIELGDPNCKWNEQTDFSGSHYVESYVVQNNVCIAKAHIDVPIDTINGTE